MVKISCQSRFFYAAMAGVFLSAWVGGSGRAQNETGRDQLPEFNAKQKSELNSGKAILLPHRPDESKSGKIDKKFSTFAIFLPDVSVKEAWDVVNDKEGATKFVGGVLKSDVLEKGGNWMLLEQETVIGGPKKSYRYVLKYTLSPHEKALFTYKEGEVNDVQGGWWFFERKEKKGMYLVYSLYIDPGIFAPQFIVRSGMKKSLPETLGYMKAEILRRKKKRGR